LDIYLYWHTNIDTDPASIWLRGQIQQAMQAAG